MAATGDMKKVEFYSFRGSPSGKLTKTMGTRELKPGQVVVRVTHSGVCGTDEHWRRVDMALGHEGVGVVEEVYPGVNEVKVGDRVGFGYVHWTCGTCDACLKGYDQYCLNREEFGTHDHDLGSYGSHVVWPAKTLYILPEGLESRHAGPLFCGGATVWGALVVAGPPVLAGQTVGVVGIGGLGHLAIQFAAKIGAEVIAFSSTDSKRDEALAFGASQFYATKNLTKFGDELTKKIDHLLITTSEQPNFELYLPIMAPLGVLYPLTVDFDKTPVPMLPLLVEGRSIQGSATAPRYQMQRMLEFAAKHGVKPVTMEWPMTVDGIEDALKTLKEGGMRYRGIIVA